ncbi:MAG: proteasome accessory factor PafA2 family protein [Fimbriimonadaceae bacterium]|nr:proteasome accessory factor PafA2 family protein [Fimbriimonadaceae bacterium]
MLPSWLLAGIETEYGLWIEGRGADSQVNDSMMLVRGYPDEHFAGWDYRFESPRADLRGFRLEHLAVDPEDAKFDAGKSYGTSQDVRSDRILPNGARFYNDHGHPEYATPECRRLDDLVRHDLAGEQVVLRAAQAFAEQEGLEVKVYKNNTDFHGASYGTHESYLVPRRLGFEAVYRAVVPILVARQVLCGAGKVGSETGGWCDFQLSARADFFVEPYNAETLFRRPVFNTRDEPHADPREWMRLHVICGDANRIPSCTRRKVGLVQMAVALASVDQAPVWRLRDPVRAFQSISRGWIGGDREFKIELDGASWTTARHIIESYLAAFEAVFGLQPETEYAQVATESRALLEDLTECPERFAQHVDWAAKFAMLDAYRESEGLNWKAPIMQSLDLEYHNVDPEESLFEALVQSEQDESVPEISGLLEAPENSRAMARGLAASRFKDHLVTATWAALTFEVDGQQHEIHLDPTKSYPAELREIDDVGRFIARLKEIEAT